MQQPTTIDQTCFLEGCGSKEIRVKCLVCNMAVYCSAEHKKAGKKEHKTYCARLAKFSAGNVLQPTPTQAPTIPTTQAPPKKDLIVVDFLQLCELVNQQVLWDNYVNHDASLVVSYPGMIPRGIKRFEDLRTETFSKLYLVESPQGMQWFRSKEAFQHNNFSLDDFWTLHCLDKAQPFCMAFVSAMRHIELNYNLAFQVSIPGTAKSEELEQVWMTEVLCVKKYDNILVADWRLDKEQLDKVIKEQERSDRHIVLLVTTKGGHRLYLDFTGPKFGVFDKDKNGYPFFFQQDVAQGVYATSNATRGISPATIDKLFEREAAQLEQTLAKMKTDTATEPISSTAGIAKCLRNKMIQVVTNKVWR